MSNKPSEFHQCVRFHSETDGRSNFPSQGDFHSFCKQRDLFYSIKTTWDQNKYENTSEIATSFPTKFRSSSHCIQNPPAAVVDPLQSKIKTLFNLNSGWANLSHFATLFTSQFLIDALEEKQQCYKDYDHGEDEQMRNMRQSNPDRFAKLNNRMSSAAGLTCLEDQDFLAFQKHFLKAGESPKFHQHLIDRITFEINQIEASMDLSNQLSMDERVALAKKVILLSKFLGYLIFFPYSDRDVQNPRGASLDKETFLNKQFELRRNQKPPMDLMQIFRHSVAKRRMTFTLAWIAEFLNSADTLALQLPSYSKMCHVVNSIYLSLLKVESNNPKAPVTLNNICRSISCPNQNFLRLCCGKICKSEKFLISLRRDKFEDEDKMLIRLSPLPLNGDIVILQNKSCQRQDDEDGLPLDSQDVFGERLIKTFFTSSNLVEAKCTAPNGKNKNIIYTRDPNCKESVVASSSTAKHIRPIPAKNSQQPFLTVIHVQKQLESSFFDGNSVSVKKTVDFVADRIASNYVKQLRKLLPIVRSEMAQKGIFEEVAAISCRNKMLEECTSFSKEKCYAAVAILIGDSVSHAATSICQQIASRIASDKVREWVNCHIKSEMFPETSPVPDLTEKNSLVPNISEYTNCDCLNEYSSYSSMILFHKNQKQLYGLESSSPPDSLSVLQHNITDIPIQKMSIL